MTTATLGVLGEHEWLAVSLVADQAYLFTGTGLTDEAVIAVGMPDVLNEGTYASTTTNEFIAPTSVWFTPTSSGTYYIDISDPGTTAAETYSITAVTEPNKFPDDTQTTGTVAVNGAATTGTLGVLGEHEWLAVSLVADQAYLFTGTGLTDEAVIAVGMPNVLNDGTYASTTTNEFISPTSVWFTPTSSGTYYIDISDPGTTAAETYSITAVTEPNKFPDDTQTTGTVAVNGAATTGTLGVIGEHEWLAVSLVADQAYLFTGTGLTDEAVIAVGMPNVLNEGTYASTTTNEFISPTSVWFTPTSSGTYYIDISDPGTTAAETYSITAVTEPNKFPDDTQTTGTVAVNGAATTGTLGVLGEHEWLAVSLVADQAYLLTGTGLTDEAVIAVGMPNVLNEGTYASTTTNEFISPTSVWFTPTSSGTYYIDISDPGTIAAETYGITAVTEPNKFPDDTQTTGTVAVNGAPTTGTLGVLGEHQWLAVSLVADQAYLFTGTGLTDEAVIAVGMPNVLNEGTYASTTTNEFISPTSMWFTPTSSGTYYIDISDPGTIAAETYSITAVTEPNKFPDDTQTTGTVAIACYLAGTKIITRSGERPVERLRPGDLVQTASGKYMPIKWLGHRRIHCVHHPRPRDVWPVRIETNAFGDDQPCRNLWLSPEHAVFVDGVLIPVKHLINGTTIVQEEKDEVTYWHVELERHDVIFAERLTCESYLDTGNRRSFTNGGGTVQLHPEYGPHEDCEAIWEAAACAPMRIEGATVARVISRLHRRAKRLHDATHHTVRSRMFRRCTTGIELTSLVHPEWYRATYSDVAASGTDAAVHYAGWGRQEGRQPCPEVDLIRGLGLIDPGILIFTMEDVIAAGMDPVDHYCETGWRERRRPSTYFDTGWYVDCNDLPKGINPLLHYVLVGENQGLKPSRHFDPAWYRWHYGLKPSVSALAHYLKYRRTRRFSPLPTFDVTAYIKAHAATLLPGRDPYAHYLAIGQHFWADTPQANLVAA